MLLHSSYPYTREAGYLTSVYPNVYLDFGEVSAGRSPPLETENELHLSGLPCGLVRWTKRHNYTNSGADADGQNIVLECVSDIPGQFAQCVLTCPAADGHWWPETYYLGNIQARKALYEVFSKSVEDGDLTEGEAVTMVENALFYNANKLYRLGLKPAPT